ncbi:ribonuclease toxin HepT-like protein [Egbenema bharatensis]|uniref:ribonuclease toxin HepT-like protein n=1 Tax=Egbenema bharatensis TaxID=3463334 RepID=UPI003A877FEC
MEREQIAGLTAELNAQLRLVERVHQRLSDRVSLGLDTPPQLDSVAYQIHNLYCAAEDLLKLIAHAFENRIGAGSEWHRTLLLRLSQPILGVRPALLTEETFDLMKRLRSFRHFIRHGYGAEIQFTQLKPNLDLAMSLPDRLSQDVQHFLAQLGAESDPL